jgi:hypothetical protein
LKELTQRNKSHDKKMNADVAKHKHFYAENYQLCLESKNINKQKLSKLKKILFWFIKKE